MAGYILKILFSHLRRLGCFRAAIIAEFSWSGKRVRTGKIKWGVKKRGPLKGTFGALCTEPGIDTEGRV